MPRSRFLGKGGCDTPTRRSSGSQAGSLSAPGPSSRIWGPGRQVAEVVKGEVGGAIATRETTYLHANALGSPEVLTRADGTVAQRQTFDAFGRPSVTEVGGPTGVLAGFTGHQQDDRLGLVDMRGRVYDGAIGRFLTPDPVVANPFWSQGLNAYAYVFNDPLNLRDPTGLIAENPTSPPPSPPLPPRNFPRPAPSGRTFSTRVWRALASIPRPERPLST